MKGFSRSEYILVGGVPHLLEMNTTPGLTKNSILPQQAKAAGISLTNLFDNAIEEAMNNDIVNNEDSSAESHPDKEGQPDSTQPPFQQRLGDIEGREEA